jgi:hypothetical protein
MATRIYSIQVTVPAGTLQSAPQVTPWKTEDNLINLIELEVPPGHNGLTGIRVMKGDVPLLPYNTNAFIVANAYVNSWTVNDYLPTGDITIQTFNTGAYAHTFYLRMTVSDWDRSGASNISHESQAIPVGTVTAPPDPLSPDAILGVTTADQLANGQLTADQLQPVSVPDLTAPPQPKPTGL